ncbi:hypothetical protein [Streptomyces thermodiastaticus]|uniref:hypothetical protein n=1 Tax=Streptomyces thermodiastaticus TaxID=44061 RepID=UPI001672F7AB|nr:hypothetical protein [Streptomyces thermodiastaticus]MCE7549162.1 hypothetical protein [Streptomyces thermodiastaticus]GHF60617.1 hypothetical protein GCM10018787_05980 [Streptomyces thermodiastaticus]
MRHGKAAFTLAIAAGTALGVPALAGTAQAAPTCNPGETCYVMYWDEYDDSRVVSNPDTYYCYPMPYGAVKGYNHTGRTVWLYKYSRVCGGAPDAKLSPGYSWYDPSTRYYSFDFS